MDVLEAIKSRRSIRKYEKEPVSEEQINEILEAGRWAPSAGNRQPWKFIVLTDAQIRKEMAEVFPTGKWFSEAPLGIAVVVAPGASKHHVQDGAATTQNMLLAAHALGLGGCWIGAYDTPEEEKAKQLLGIPEEERLVSLISIGHPAEAPQKTRKGLDEIAFANKYGAHRL